MSDIVQFISAATRDPAEYELTLRPWELQCLPQTAGDFQHSITAIRSPLFIIYRETYNLGVKIRGISPTGMLAFGIPLDVRSQTCFWGNRPKAAEIPGLLPGPIDVQFGCQQSILVTLVDVEYLRSSLSPMSMEKLQLAAQLRRFQAPANAIDDFASWACRLLKRTKSRRQPFEPPAVAAAILRELVDFLALLADHQSSERKTPDLATRRQGLTRVLEFLRHRLDAQVSLAELCREAGIGERSLQTVFREEFGLSPSEFMRRRRLHAARQKLLTSNRAETTVSQIAMACGFFEFGRFSGEYRRLFGESPSSTLGRC